MEIPTALDGWVCDNFIPNTLFLSCLGFHKPLSSKLNSENKKIAKLASH